MICRNFMYNVQTNERKLTSKRFPPNKTTTRRRQTTLRRATLPTTTQPTSYTLTFRTRDVRPNLPAVSLAVQNFEHVATRPSLHASAPSRPNPGTSASKHRVSRRKQTRTRTPLPLPSEQTRRLRWRKAGRAVCGGGRDVTSHSIVFADVLFLQTTSGPLEVNIHTL